MATGSNGLNRVSSMRLVSPVAQVGAGLFEVAISSITRRALFESTQAQVAIHNVVALRCRSHHLIFQSSDQLSSLHAAGSPLKQCPSQVPFVAFLDLALSQKKVLFAPLHQSFALSIFQNIDIHCPSSQEVIDMNIFLLPPPMHSSGRLFIN